MKQQTYIVYLEDAQGKTVTFERFSCKRLATVKKNMRSLWNESLYRACCGAVKVFKIFETPDGYHTGSGPCAVMFVDEFGG